LHVSAADEVFPNVFRITVGEQSLLATRNLTPSITFYNEPTYQLGGVEYRSWNPTRSKLAAAIMKGLKSLPIKPGSRVLYLGASSGTTVSHVSDIIEEKGHVWGLDFAARSLRDLIDKVSRHRENVSPILGDARRPQQYSMLVPKVDTIFADVAQPDQAQIVVRNSDFFLHEHGWVMLSIKSRSIDVTEKPEEVYRREVEVLELNGYRIHELIELDPYERDHAMAVAQFSENRVVSAL
jgi:fibrillarin-like pre-rRNA processing protein